MERALIRVDGYVQGVGFRWWTQSVSRELGVVGSARNLSDGRVEIDAQGSTEALGSLIQKLIEQPTRGGRPGRVNDHTVDWIDPEPGRQGFTAR